MTPLQRYLALGHRVGCPRGQMNNFVQAGIVLQDRQLAASAAARLCDRPDGPTASATAAPGAAANRTGSWPRWALTTASASRA